MHHRINSGETLSGLAQRFGTTVEKLARDNGISNPDLIITGNSLKISGGSDGFDGASAAGGPGGPGGVAGPGGVSAAGGPDAGGGVSPDSVGQGGNSDLAAQARRVAMSMGGYNSQGLCATGVSRALAASMGISVSGNGNQIDDNLPRDKFKQVNMSLEEALKIPGAVMTWEQTSTRLGRIYGHTAISSGDGSTSYSDFIEQPTTNNGRSGFKVFLPT